MRADGTLVVGLVALLGASLGAAAAVGAPARAPEPAGPAADVVPRRIASSMLSTDEILLSLLPPERLLAVGRFATDPRVSHVADAAGEVRFRIGLHDPEVLVALEPDVLFVDAFAQPEVQDMLGRAGVPVVRLPAVTSFDEIGSNVRRVGELVGQRDAAERLVASMNTTIREVARRTEDADRPRVLLLSRGYTAGEDTLFDEMLRFAGGRNAALELGIRGHARVPIERGLALDPDVIVVNEFRADSRERRVVPRLRLADDPLWEGASAVRFGRVYEVDARSVMSNSHFAADGVVALATALHPDRMGADR